MPAYEYDLGIIGGGAAGLTVAAGAAQLGAKTLLIEKEKELGGDCLHFGCVPSKTLIKSARVYHQMKRAGAYGLPPMEILPVDFSRVAARIRAVISAIQAHDSEERFCTLGAKVVFGAPEFIDDRAVSVNGKTASAKNWVIATGSSPAIPPIEGLDRTPYITNREIFSLERLPRSMIVLGGGPIGVEMAQAFNRFGSKVCVIDRGEQILKKEDRDMADALMDILQNEGVEFLLNSQVDRVKNLGDTREVDLTDAGGNKIQRSAETLLVALGRRPNVEGLGLENIGVAFDPRGIQVDPRMRTSTKHIFAAGDVSGGFLFTHAAGYEGGIVLSNAIFHLPRKVDYTLLPWCTYADPELANIGMNEKRAETAGIDYSVITEPFSANDRSLAEDAPDGKIKLVLNEKGKPIGVQILGLHAGDLLGEWVAAFNGKVKLSVLASAVHPYPTVSEINKRLAGNYFAPKIFSEKVKKGLKFFFNLKGRACELP